MKQLKQWIKEQNFHAIVTFLETKKNHEKLYYFLRLPVAIAAIILINLSPYSRKWLVQHIPHQRLVNIIRLLKSDDSVDILHLLPEHILFSILKELPEKQRKQIEELLAYDSDSAGGMMEAEVLTLEQTMTIKEAQTWLRKHYHYAPREHNIYIVNKKRQLVGVLSYPELFLAPKTKQLKQIMNKHVVFVHPHSDKEHVARIFREKKITSLPVVNKERQILGKITYDDALKVLEEETAEDYLKLFGSDTDLNIFDPVKKHIQKRLPWLVINLFTAILASAVVALFEDTISKLVILAVFMPIVAGMGGNTGSQCLTMATRAIALSQLTWENAKKVLTREFLLGLIHGAIIGMVVSIIAMLWKGNTFIGLIIFLAMVINMIIGGVIGILIPLLLKKIGIDPAVASGVIVTTFTDVGGFFAFLGLAALLLHYYL